MKSKTLAIGLISVLMLPIVLSLGSCALSSGDGTDTAETYSTEARLDESFVMQEATDKLTLYSYTMNSDLITPAVNIFSEMYRVPEKIRIPYFKVKILELLLYIYAMNVPEEDTERPYFYRTQVEKVKAIRQFLIGHISENFTQEALSRRFNIPMTAMKSCFRSV